MHSAGESKALKTLRVTVRDLIKSFRKIEYPFLKPEYQNQGSAQWSSNSTPYGPPEKSPHYSDDELSDLHDTANRLEHEYKK